VPTNFGGQNMLGVMQDPVFGKVKASLFTQFRLTQNNFSLGDAPVLDSLTISFEYSGSYYGQVETFQTLKIYELSEQIPDVDTLYSNISLAHYPDPVAELLLRPAPTDSVLIDTIMFAPHFRIRLSDELGQKIIDANGTPAFENVPNFLEYFKGFTSPWMTRLTEPAVSSTSICSIFFTRLSFITAKRGIRTPCDMTFPSPSSPSDPIFLKPSAMTMPIRCWLSSFFGEEPSKSETACCSCSPWENCVPISVSLIFPELSEAANVTINQARLIVPIAEGFADEMFTPAQELLLLRYDENGKLVPIADMQFGDEYFGGTYNEGERQYSFNITQHLQQVMDGKVLTRALPLPLPGQRKMPGGSC
jgi:hypothetical protein